MAPIRDQGQRGTCVAFAVTAGHEVSRGPASNPDDLSEEALYWGCKTADGDWHGGTTFSSARTAITRWGQPLEARWPYNHAQADGAEIKLPAGMKTSDWYRSGLRRVSVAVADLQALLASGNARGPGVDRIRHALPSWARRPGPGSTPARPSPGAACGPCRRPRAWIRPDSQLVGLRLGPRRLRLDHGAYVNKFVIDAWIVDRAASGTLRAKSKLRPHRSRERFMDLSEYQREAQLTDQFASRSDDLPVDHRVVPLLGMAGEVGSLLAEYKKWLRDGPAHVLFPDQVAEELGDILWYLANAATRFDLDLDVIARLNLDKTRDRWPPDGKPSGISPLRRGTRPV